MILSSDVDRELAGYPGGCLGYVTERALGEGDSTITLASVELGSLDDNTGWQRIEDEGLRAATDRYLAVLDGPLRGWVDRRRSASLLLATQAAPGSKDGQNAGLVRSMAVLAAQTGAFDDARQLVGGYRPNGRNDTDERVAWFERELAKRHPAYGPLQRMENGG